MGDAREMARQRMEQRRAKSLQCFRSRRNDKKNQGTKKELTPRQLYAHMQGKTGIPLFYLHGMKLKPPRILGSNLFSKKKSTTIEQIPLYFSYEDLVSNWKKTTKKKIIFFKYNNAT